ncbi:hypothetical protein ACFX11_026014 [Malus domestica]
MLAKSFFSSLKPEVRSKNQPLFLENKVTKKHQAQEAPPLIGAVNSGEGRSNGSSLASARCNHIFNDKAITPAQVIHFISYTYDAYWEANHPCPSPSPPPPNSHLLVFHWCPANESFLKTNVDASWLPAEGRGCSAAVVCNHGGRFVAARKLSILPRRVVVAEAMALLHVCELAAELGYRRVTFESDSS